MVRSRSTLSSFIRRHPILSRRCRKTHLQELADLACPEAAAVLVHMNGQGHPDEATIIQTIAVVVVEAVAIVGAVMVLGQWLLVVDSMREWVVLEVA